MIIIGLRSWTKKLERAIVCNVLWINSDIFKTDMDLLFGPRAKIIAYSPCIVCVQYHGGCSVPWGISWVPWGDILSTVGDIMINVGDILSTVGGYLEYRGGCSVPWGISWCTWGYHEYRGECSVPWGEIFRYLSTPRYWAPPRYSWYPPHVSWYPPTVLKFQRMVSPTVLNTPRYFTKNKKKLSVISQLVTNKKFM